MSKTKKSRLSKTEKYVIQGMLVDSKSVEKIAQELDRPVAVINKYVDSQHKENDVQEIVKTPKRKGLNSLDLMTSDRDEKGKRPIVMTKAASERGARFAQEAGGFTKRHEGCIFDTDGESLTEK